MEVTNLFPLPISKVKVVPTEAERNMLEQYLTDTFNKVQEGTWASETGKSSGELGLFLHTVPEMQWLINSIRIPVFKYWELVDYAHGASIYPWSSWANLHKPGQVTGEHSHCDGSEKSHVSTVYYFKKPKDSGHIEFRDPLEYIHSLSPRHMYNDEIEPKAHTAIEADEFDLLIFPSWMKHRSQINLSQDDRIAISINYRGEW